jgi:hypothetical protein
MLGDQHVRYAPQRVIGRQWLGVRDVEAGAGEVAAAESRILAPEAKERLREIVEGFFFRRLRTEDGKPIRRRLVKSPPGLGKTREAIASVVHYQEEQEGKDLLRLPRGDFNEAAVAAQTSIFVPRHQLAGN